MSAYGSSVGVCVCVCLMDTVLICVSNLWRQCFCVCLPCGLSVGV